eukprot:3174586-Rhodomonas_salina.1
MRAIRRWDTVRGTRRRATREARAVPKRRTVRESPWFTQTSIAESTSAVPFVPGMRFHVLDFAAKDHALKTTRAAVKLNPTGHTPALTHTAGLPSKTDDTHRHCT